MSRAIRALLISAVCIYSTSALAGEEDGASGLPALTADPGTTVTVIGAPASTPIASASLAKDASAPTKEPTPKAVPHKTDAMLESALAAGSSSWPGDPAVLSELRLGFRFMETGALYVQTGLGYAPVNNRELVEVGFGAQLWLHLWKVKPFARLAVLHQHEESTASWKNDFGESLLGIGNGIRHRAGAEAALGMDFPFYRTEKVEIDGSIEASTPWYPDDRGPHFYLLGSLGLGVHYAL